MALCKTALLISLLLSFSGVGSPAEPAADEAGSSPEMVDSADFDQQSARLSSLVRDGALDEAENVAKGRVEAAIRQSGPRSIDTAFALTDLGSVQVRTEQFVAAEQNFQTAIEIIGEVENRLHAFAVDPLKGLGQAYLESGKPELAIPKFSAAIHITHVNSGPHNIEQVELLESLAESQLRAGQDSEARDTQDLILAINDRYYRDDRLAMVAPLMRRGEWLFRNNSFLEARDTYRQVVRIIESEHGKNDLRLIEPLIQLGRTYLYVDMTGAQPLAGTAAPTGESYHKRALRIAEKAPAIDWTRLVSTQLALGDFYTLRDDYNSAWSSYRKAWDLMSADPSRRERRADLLGDAYPLTKMSIPPLSARTPDTRGIESEGALLVGSITATYMINDRGRVTNLDVAEVDPPQFTEMADHVMRELRRRIFRPRFDETGPVATPSQEFTHWFQYSRAELDLLRSREAADD
jgi:tetratricopeptide (TPR) repeat protein